MKQVMMPAIGAAIVLTLFSAIFANQVSASKKQTHINNGNGFAVLELFTSEGCSSCPPADALLARIQQEAGNKPIYVLAYHVDYWNRLGWKDVFSQPQYSKRQYQYSQQLPSQVYTPQLVVNGQTSCIGSDESAVTNAIGEALGNGAAATLGIKAQLQPVKASLTYAISGNTGNSQLLVAVVQKHAVSKVERGENEGRTLSHAQVVRELQTLKLRDGKQGTAEINLPENFNAQEWELIGLLQNPATGAINAATRVSL